jgi:hypothetical protein
MFSARRVTHNRRRRETVANDLDMLFEQIDALIAAPSPPPRASIERTLTDGYARALTLEGEGWRLERRIGELAGELHEADKPRTEELAALAKRLSSSRDELTRLRSVLDRLRAHVAVVETA